MTRSRATAAGPRGSGPRPRRPAAKGATPGGRRRRCSRRPRASRPRGTTGATATAPRRGSRLRLCRTGPCCGGHPTSARRSDGHGGPAPSTTATRRPGSFEGSPVARRGSRAEAACSRCASDSAHPRRSTPCRDRPRCRAPAAPTGAAPGTRAPASGACTWLPSGPVTLPRSRARCRQCRSTYGPERAPRRPPSRPMAGAEAGACGRRR
mmetsp:Transcript_109331/g.315999  ORF Transcript_109331/g.315999 Transcript_109331/m.315999 type:complete len:209 (-) Transcript_109331:282-908(-)